MQKNLTELIEAWFAERDDGEFVAGIKAFPYSVVVPATDGGRINFTTKPTLVSAAIFEQEVSDELGMIGRYGLPSQTDLNWISRVIGPRKLLFLGDMDPVDLMVFAWLRAGLHPKRVTHIGVNDAFLKAIKISSTKILSNPCAPSEQQSLAILKKVLPDLSKTVGHNCAHMLEQGRKIELDGIVSDRKKAVAIARLVRSQGRRGVTDDGY